MMIQLIRRLISPHITAKWSNDQFIKHQRDKAEKRSAKKGLANNIDVYLAFDDPYSYLLVQVLPDFQKRFNLDCRIYLIHDRQKSMFPEPEKWQDWALDDAQTLATLYDLDAITEVIPEEKLQYYQYHWFMKERQNKQLLSAEEALSTFKKLNSNQPTIYNIEVQSLKVFQKQLRLNSKMLTARGHYLAGTINFAGEWYWGLDRLDHLERRLIEKGWDSSVENTRLYTRTWNSFCSSSREPVQDKNIVIELFFSMRSPYSYIALMRCILLSEHYQIPLKIRPILPMLMRGLPVPKNKTKYIFMDTVRESKKFGLAYGKVADPLGKGVENCYALWEWVEKQGKGVTFMKNFADAVHTQGLPADTNKGLKIICARSGIDFNTAKPLLKKQQWRKWAKSNLEELDQLGLWGVPCVRVNDVVVWGQDRIWRIEKAIRELA